ncbi:GNAT family N-acetyltransferase [Micromonospora sp. CPCC 206061]|uniref:GNAT family N-acetyltransferase n=1 Tax=Micromonospora sp. CPCC 206061 TaxID=3122410 RepID=UPI002FF3FC3E
MTAPKITVASVTDRDTVVDSLVAAFVKDPVLRYLFPDENTYPRYAAAFFWHLFDKRVHKQSIWTIERGASVAIWQPPGASEGGKPPLLEDEQARVDAYDEALHAALPTTPFWYLGVLGTHPDHAGRGWGRMVMAEGLRRAAADGLPAILETSNPGNVEFYRRAGWNLISTVESPLPIWIMQQ